MFREFFIGRYFIQIGIASRLGTFDIVTEDAICKQLLAIQTIDAADGDTGVSIFQVILGPLLFGIGVVDER